MKRTFAPIVALLVFLASTGAALFVASYSKAVDTGPYTISRTSFDATTGGSAGGDVVWFKNGADTLLVGDVVYISANNTVRKSATLANYNTIVGVVVGGIKTSSRVQSTIPGASDTAAYANSRVLVMRRGRYWVKIDSGQGYAPGSVIIPSSKAGEGGKVTAKTTAIDSFYRAIGKLVDSGITSTRILAEISVR